MNHERAVIRGRLAAAVRYGNDEAAERFRREMKHSLAEEYIQVLNEAPRPTSEQRARLAALLLAESPRVAS